jgi:hypothetical protein
MGSARRRGSLWTGIIVVAVFFVAVTLAVASLGGGPDVPHGVPGEQASCTTCHAVERLPQSHRDRVDAGCRSCHAERPGLPEAETGGT